MSTALLTMPELGPNTLSPRPYQTAAIEAARAELAKHRSTAIILPTGVGKTVVFAFASRRCVEKGGRALVLAHREELITQAANTLERAGLFPGVERADSHARSAFEPNVVVASVQTLHAKRLQTWDPDYFRLIVVDEAHHATAKSYQRIIKHFRRAKLLGVTATPDRADDDSIASVFDSIAYEMTIWQAMTAEAPGPWLCPLKVVRCETPVDLRGIKTTGGDFNLGDLESRIGPAIETLANAIAAKVGDRQTIVFTPDCGSASAMATALQSLGFEADYVWGDSPDRAAKVRRYQEGHTRILVNCALLTEGFDAPHTSAIALCRPTKSRPLYSQMCLDEDTEILTARGWMTPDSIADNDVAAAFDLDGGRIRWSPILSRVDRRLQPEETMYGIASPSLDIRLTDQHRMVRRRIIGRDKHRGEWEFVTARELSETKSSYEIPVSGYQDSEGLNLTDSEIRFIGWFLTDGGINKTTRQITIYQDHRSPYLDDIKRCLDGCGFKYSVYKEARATQFSADSTIVRFTVSEGEPRGRDKDRSGWGRLGLFIDKNFSVALEGLNRLQLGVLIDEMNKGDGLKRADVNWRVQTTSICTGNKTMADRLQSLCVRRGYRCNIAEGDWNASPIYILHIKDEQARYVGGCNWADRPTFEQRIHMDFERVWCIEVETGAIVTRRNGKVAIVGNCGRGTRIANGKDDCLLIDFAWLTDSLDLVRPADLFDRTTRGDDEAEILNEAIANADGAVDLVEASKKAKAESERRQVVRIKAKPLDVKMRWVSYDAIDMAATLGVSWRGAAVAATHNRASEKQVQTLAKFGVTGADEMSKRLAGKMLDTIFDRRKRNLATPKQVTWCVKMGMDPSQAREMTFQDASAFLDKAFGKRA